MAKFIKCCTDDGRDVFINTNLIKTIEVGSIQSEQDDGLFKTAWELEIEFEGQDLELMYYYVIDFETKEQAEQFIGEL